MRSLSSSFRPLALVVLGLVSVSSARAATALYWDPSGTSTYGGTANWDTSSSFWTPNVSGGGSLQAWPSSGGTGYTANFNGSSAGTVTLTNPISLNSLNLSYGYTINSGDSNVSDTLSMGGYASNSMLLVFVGSTLATGSTATVNANMSVAAFAATGGNFLKFGSGSGTTGKLQINSNLAVTGVTSGTQTIQFDELSTGTLGFDGVASTNAGTLAYNFGDTTNTNTAELNPTYILGATNSGITTAGILARGTVIANATNALGSAFYTLGSSSITVTGTTAGLLSGVGGTVSAPVVVNSGGLGLAASSSAIPTFLLGGQQTSGYSSFTGNVHMNTITSASTAATTLTSAGSGVVTFSGLLFDDGPNDVVSGTGTNYSIKKTGAGVVRLTNAGGNKYSGNTSVLAGGLYVDNTTTSTVGSVVSGGLGSGAVTVGDTSSPGTLATLGGTGTLVLGSGNNVTVNANGILSPGDPFQTSPALGPLTLSMASGSKLSFASGSTLALTLGTSSSNIAFGAAGDWLSGAGNATLSLTLGSGFSYGSTYTVFQNATTSGFNFASITGYDTSTEMAVLSQSGNNYILSFNAVPEPGTWVLLGLGVGFIYLVFRRRFSLVAGR